MLFQDYNNYTYWINNASKYNILDVLSFCGSYEYIMETIIYLSGELNEISFNRSELTDFDLKIYDENLRAVFTFRYSYAHSSYKHAVLRNPHLKDDFYQLIIADINWAILCENRGVSKMFFANNAFRYNYQICVNPNIRPDLFNIYYSSNVAMNTIERLQHKLIPWKDLQGLSCTKTEEKQAYKNRFIAERSDLGNYKKFLARHDNTESYQFWYNLCVLNYCCLIEKFCDDIEFIETNYKWFVWSNFCSNIYADDRLLLLKKDDIDLNVILTRKDILPGIFNEFVDEISVDNIYDYNQKLLDQPTGLDAVYHGNIISLNPMDVMPEEDHMDDVYSYLTDAMSM